MPNNNTPTFAKEFPWFEPDELCDDCQGFGFLDHVGGTFERCQCGIPPYQDPPEAPPAYEFDDELPF
jgi:hypothetical protein